jgi:hypothetical protein
MQRHLQRNGRVGVPELLFVFACTGLPLLLASSPLPTNKPAHYPAWWFERDVLPRSTNIALPVWPDHYLAADDYALVNQGQVQHLAHQAYAEFDARLPGGAGSNLAALIGGFGSDDPYVLANVGQVKKIARPFYDRLIEAGHISGYSWDAGIDDYALANVGQVKNLFNFDLTLLDPPLAPRHFSAWEQDNGSVDLDWEDASTNETGFLIERSDDNGQTWQLITTVAANSIGYTVAAAQAGTSGSSRFRSRSTNAAGSSSSADSGQTAELEPSGDKDNDGLSNAEEIEYGTEPDIPDTDEDGTDDGPDGWARDKAMSPPRLPETRYAVIDLRSHGFNWISDFSDSNEILAHNSQGFVHWKQGQLTVLPSSNGYYWGALNNQGTVLGSYWNGSLAAWMQWSNGATSVLENDFYGHIPSSVPISAPEGYKQTGYIHSFLANNGTAYTSISGYGESYGSNQSVHYSHAGLASFSGGVRTLLPSYVYQTTTYTYHSQSTALTMIPADSTALRVLMTANAQNMLLGSTARWYQDGTEMKWENKGPGILDNGVLVRLEDMAGSSAGTWLPEGKDLLSEGAQPYVVGLNNDQVALWSKRQGTWTRVYPPMQGAGSGIVGHPAGGNGRAEVIGYFTQGEREGKLIRNGRVLDLDSCVSGHVIEAVYRINEAGSIIAYGRKTEETAEESGWLMLVPYEFALRDSTHINTGWDPPIKGDIDLTGARDEDDWVPWTLVSKGHVHGQHDRNELTKLVFPSDATAQLFELAVSAESAAFIEINEANPGQPLELTEAETLIAIIGKNGNPAVTSNATIELRSKLDHQVVGKMRVKVVPDLQPLNLKFYAATDSRFLNGTLGQESSHGTSIREDLSVNGAMYAEAQARFKQCGLNFALAGTVQEMDVPYLNAVPSGTIFNGEDELDISLGNRASIEEKFGFMTSEPGHIRTIFVHLIKHSVAGNYFPEVDVCFIAIDLWHQTVVDGVVDHPWGPDRLFEPENEIGEVKSAQRVYAHEIAHSLGLCARPNPEEPGPPGFTGGHDDGPGPSKTALLMRAGTAKLGKWMRHEDWHKGVAFAINRINNQ